MARMTNDQVAHAWAHRQAGDSGNLHSDGIVIKSYSTPIGVWIDGVAFISSDGMSPTTASKHLAPLRRAVGYSGPNVFYTLAFGYNDRSAPSARECILEAAHAMEDAFKTLCRSRTYVTEGIERYEARRAEILRMAERFQVPDLPAMPEATGDLKAKAKELATKDRERKAEETRRREETERAQRIIDQGQLDLWLQQGRGQYPYSFRQRGADQITIKNGFTDPGHAMGMPTRNPSPTTVITSQGAEAPLAHVIKALRFYDSRKALNYKVTCNACGHVEYYDNPAWNASGCFQAGGCGARKFGLRTGECIGYKFTPYHTNGHKIALGLFVLDSIDEAGNVKAGCHTFSAAEIARFRKQWKL